jgi:hypothetical protein
MEAAHFVALPRYAPRPHWAIAIELAATASEEQLEALRQRIETELGLVNEEYPVFRQRVLGPLVLHVIARGESEAKRQALIAAGKPEAQLKTVHLVTDDSSLATFRIERRIEARA